MRGKQGFPFQIKFKSIKVKQAETIWARSAQHERRRRELLGGSGGMPPPENFEKLSALRRNLVHFGCPNEADEQASQTQEMTTYLIKCSPFLLHHMKFCNKNTNMTYLFINHINLLRYFS